MKDQVTSLEQSQRLIELGVPAEKASMRWERHPHFVADRSGYPLKAGDDWYLEIGGVDAKDDKYVPVFTVADLLGLLPNEIIDKKTRQIYTLLITYGLNEWSICYSGGYDSACVGCGLSVSLLELLYDCIEWLLLNDYKLNL